MTKSWWKTGNYKRQPNETFRTEEYNILNEKFIGWGLIMDLIHREK